MRKAQPRRLFARAGPGVWSRSLEGTLPSVDAIASALMEQLTGNSYDPAQVRWELYERYTARNTTRILAEALDAAYTQFHARSE